jgi:LuxR family maltose regulon positive regulatory protein
MQAYPLDPEQPLNPMLLSSYDIYVRWLLIQEQLQTAAQFLQKCEQFAKQKGLFSNLIRIYLLQAQLASQKNDNTKAAALVEQALELAAPETLVAPFLAASPEVKQLCGRFRQPYGYFVDQIIPAVTTGAVTADLHTAVEPLSERELEILQLIAQGLSNRDIANQLVITVGTTKWHVHNILSKLGVKRRTQAVAKARELQWL